MSSTSKQRVVEHVVQLLSVSRAEAEQWYEQEVIPAFGMTVKQAVEQGHIEAVLEHIRSIAVGGYA